VGERRKEKKRKKKRSDVRVGGGEGEKERKRKRMDNVRDTWHKMSGWEGIMKSSPTIWELPRGIGDSLFILNA